MIKQDLGEALAFGLQPIRKKTAFGALLAGVLENAAKTGKAVEIAFNEYKAGLEWDTDSDWANAPVVSLPASTGLLAGKALLDAMVASGIIGEGGAAAAASLSTAYTAIGAALEAIGVTVASTTEAGAAVVSGGATLATLGLVPIAAIMAKPEVITHVVINDSSYPLHLPNSRILNYHGKTTILPDNDEHGAVVIPARIDASAATDNQEIVWSALLQFSKDKGAGFGCEGCYTLQLLSDDLSLSSGGVMVDYYQPVGMLRDNAIGSGAYSSDPVISPDAFHSYMDKHRGLTASATLTPIEKTRTTLRRPSAPELSIHAAVDAKKGRHDWGVIFISDR